ncbi:MAG: GTPase HflX [Magnetococcus sp. DMHC-6]
MEFTHLVTTAGLEVVSQELVNLSRVSPSTWLGKGGVERLGAMVMEQEIEVVMVNGPLSPVQQRNLERAWKAKVVDRSGLILDIFAARARTREGRLQVELAMLLYQQSRLVRSWTHLERQRGGVGLRAGAGETQIEVDRRLIRVQIDKIKKALIEVQRTRTLHRNPRREVPFYSVALVGYTNAGKSTLFNRLARADVEVADKLFATLDPTMRLVVLPGGSRIILSDTVGFIRDLPHQLIAAFRSTLEEVNEADLLLHVVDYSDDHWPEQKQAVLKVLGELGAENKPMLTLFNKIDQRIDTSPIAEDIGNDIHTKKVLISAHTGSGIAELLALIEQEATSTMRPFCLHIPQTEGAFIARLYQEGRVLQRTDTDDWTVMTVALPAAVAGRLAVEIKKFQADS